MRDARRSGARTMIAGTTLALVGWLAGSASSQLVASALFDVPRVSAWAPPALPASSPPDECALLERDQVFDSALRLRCDGDDPPRPPRTPTRDPATACGPSVRLVGSYVRRGDSEQSFAAITSAAGASLLYREGMRVDERTIVAIDPSAVRLQADDGAECTISMFEVRGPALAMAGDVVLTPVVDTRGAVSSSLSAHVERISPTHFAIDRPFVDDVIARHAWPSVRVLPEEVDGHVVGMRMFGVQRESVLGQLGIQNGDSIRTVNGYDVTDPGAALDAYVQLRNAEHLTVSLTRRGQPITVDYDIR